jgi:hypothetical protein
MTGLSWRMIAPAAGLLLALGWLTACKAEPAQSAAQAAACTASQTEAAAPRLVAASSATTATTAIHLPLVARYFDRHYVYPYGVATYDGAGPAQGLVEMEAAGSRWVTTVLYWAAVEPNPPVNGVHTYNWTQYDAIISGTHAVDTDLFLLVTGNPTWAALLQGGPVTNTADLVNFVMMAMGSPMRRAVQSSAPGHSMASRTTTKCGVRPPKAKAFGATTRMAMQRCWYRWRMPSTPPTQAPA